jgi:putative oxidoreductase
MKLASLIGRYLLGLGFVIFGLNGFLQFIPQPPMPIGPAGDYMNVMMSTHYMAPVFALQLIGGILLLINRYVPLALVVLAPILVNILLFHSLMQPAGLPIALLFAILWLLVFASVRSAFAGLFQSKVEN